MTSKKLQIWFWVTFMMPAAILGFLIEMTRMGYQLGKKHVADYTDRLRS